MKRWDGAIVVAYKTNPLRILLIKNTKSGNITCPGGATEPHEQNVDAAAREFYEETGLSVRPESFMSSGIFHEFTYGSSKVERAGDTGKNELFLLDANNLQDPKKTKDAKTFYWYELDEALAKMTFTDVAALVQRAVAHL